jgi:peptidoglycan/xylan/chitin deacetylase (PgdA/CDA1 family)
MTNDVEETSIIKNRLSQKTANLVSSEGIPRLIELYNKHNIQTTFYFTGTFAENFPDSVRLVKDNGHEIGCHGYSHEVEQSFDLLTPKQQYLHLIKSIRSIEKYSGSKVRSFRAPALRIGNETIAILERLNILTDSSVSSQRFDGPLTFGSFRKLRWLTSPRLPYFPNYRNPYKAGNSKVLEIPVSAFIVAYQGTTMRISSGLNNIIGEILFKEAKITGKPIVFIFHPNEAILERPPKKIKRRGKYFLGSLFGDTLRNKLKISNLGMQSITLLENVILKAKSQGFKFVTAKEYRRLILNNV